VTHAEAKLTWLKTKDMIAVMEAGVSMLCRPGLSLKLLGSRMPKKASCAADFSLLNLPKGKSLGRSKPATNS